MEIKILYEDKDVLVLDKPAGLNVHPDGKRDEYTLVDWLVEKYPEIKGVGEPQKLSDGKIIDRSGIVHRLDKETSGVLIVAKNQKTYEFLKEQFKDRKIKKTYVALVWGDVKNDEGIIDAPIARSKNDFRKWTAQRGKRGKERDAITEYKVLKRFKIFTLLELCPKTGRTHQIRVHMKYINHPIVCDSLYAPKKDCPVRDLSRLALHAKSLEFNLLNGDNLKIEAPLPDDISRVIMNSQSF